MNWKVFSNIAAMALVVISLSGCVSKVNLPEVLQQPQASSVRTRHHIWFTDPENISPLNYMEGSFIPAGTVIEPIAIERGSYDMWGSVSVVDGKIRFRTVADGKEYEIAYDEHLTMLPIEDYLKQIFTIDSAESIYKDVPQNELTRVKAGKIERKMSKNSVLVVLGPPARSRTSSMTNQSWLYWKNRDMVFRLIYRGDKVRQIGSVDDIGL